MLERLPILAVCTLAASVGCSSSNPMSSMDGDAGPNIDGDGSVIAADVDVATALRRVDTSQYLLTKILNVAPGIIVMNGLDLGPLTVASIGPDELLELNSETLSASGSGETIGAETRKILAYAYSCALPASSSMQLEISGETWEFTGALNLAPEWETSACGVECQEWVSACILARTNQFGTEVRLSLRGDHPALTTTPTIRNQYTLREGSFYGNVFTATDTVDDHAYACAGGKGSAMWELTNRFCSAIGDGCPINTVADCNIDEFACDTAFQDCTSWTACSEWNSDGLPTTCYSNPHKCETQSPTGTAYTRIITAYIEEPVATTNGICEEGEADHADCADHWAMRYGSGCQEDSGGLSVHDSTGNIAIVGRFIGDMDFGNGKAISTSLDTDIDLFVTGVDESGGTTWSERIAVARQGMARSVATDSNGDVIVAGHFNGSITFDPTDVPKKTDVDGMSYFLAKYSGSDGTLQWSKTFESDGYWGGDEHEDLDRLPNLQVAVDSNNDIVLAATFKGTLLLGLGTENPSSGHPNESEILVASYSAVSGTRVWETTLEGDYNEAINSLAIDSENNIILGGTFEENINIGSTLLSNPLDSQGVLTRRVESFVAKLSNLGTPIWGAHFAAVLDAEVGYEAGQPEKSSILVFSLAVGANDDIVVSGAFKGALSVAGSATTTSTVDSETTSSSRDGLVVKFDKAGVRSWMKTFGDNRDDVAMEVAWNGSDRYVVATRVTADYGTIATIEGVDIASGDNGDIVIIRYDGDGAKKSVTQRGGPVAEAPKGLVANGDRVIMSGQFMGTLRFSGTYLTNSGGSSQTANPQDIFLTTIDSLVDDPPVAGL